MGAVPDLLETARVDRFETSLTVVIPAYNEAENLRVFLPSLVQFVTEQCLDTRLLLVNDGSTDETAQVLAQFQAQAPRHILIQTHGRNRGLTQALRTGFFAAQTELVTWLPADGQIALSELCKMLRAYQGQDLLLTSYRHRPDGLVRAVMSKTVRLLVAAATGFSDRLEGPYLFRTALLGELCLVSDRSAGSIGLEIGAKSRALGKQVACCEIECAPRRFGQSKVTSLTNIVSYLGEIWRIRVSQQQLLASKRSHKPSDSRFAPRRPG